MGERQVSVHRCRFVDVVPHAIEWIEFAQDGELLAVLRANADIASSMEIQTVSETGFVTGVVDGKGNRSSKDFTLAAEGEYALYVKQGWETMACATPLEQFLPDRELLEAVNLS